MKLEKIINSTKKFLRTSLLVGALALPLAGNLQAQEQETNKKSKIPIKTEQKLSFSGGFVFKYETSLINEIKNIPFEIRKVPGYSPIKDDNVELNNYISLGGRLGAKIPFDDNIKLNFGMGLDACLGEEGSPSGIKKGNSYFVEPYYIIEPRFIPIKNYYLRPNLFSEIEAKITEKIKLGLGYELFGKRIMAENGWDTHRTERRVINTHDVGWTRYTLYEPVTVGEYKTNKKYNLANIMVGNLYASLKFYKKPKRKDSSDMYYYAIDFGLTHIIKKNLTDMGKQMDIDFKNKAWFVGLRVGI